MGLASCRQLPVLFRPKGTASAGRLVPGYRDLLWMRDRHGSLLRERPQAALLARDGRLSPDLGPDEILAGLFVCSHNPDVIEEATIWNVRIDKPVSDNYNSGKEGYPGSRLETMNVFDGKRIVIFEKPGRFEAPNWMPDGTKLLFNMDGLLYKIPVTGGDLEKLNTDFANGPHFARS